MQLTIKLLVSLAVIVAATIIGRKVPSMAGLIAVMPLTGLLVLVWLDVENRHNHALLIGYTKGALLGIIPTVLFYLAMLVCLMKSVPFAWSVGVGFIVWGAAAIVHQVALR